MKKKILAITLITLVLIGAIACFVGCKDKDSDKVAHPTSMVTMDINPSINLVLDQNNNVISYSAENEDALIMLYGENIIGLNVEQASQKIIDLAIEFGYLTEDNSGIQVMVASDNSKVEANIYDKIGVVVNNADGKLTFKLNYNKEGSFILNYQVAKLKDANPDNADYQSLTPAKLELIYSAMACDWTLTMDNAVAMSNADLLAIVNNGYKQLEQYSTKAFEEIKKVSEYTYDSLVISAQDTVYLAKYTQFKGIVEGGLATAQYGIPKAASRGINELVKGLVIAEQYANEVLATEDAQAIASELGIDVEVLKDSEGNLTVDSIGAYIDKVAKNHAGEIQGDLSAKLTQAVAKLEECKQENIDKVLTVDLLEDIQTLLSTIKVEIEGIEFSMDMSIDDLKQLAINLDEYAQSTKAKMDEGMTDEQLKEIAEAQEEAVNKLQGAYEEYMNALNKAQQEATAYLEQARQQRLDHLNNQG